MLNTYLDIKSGYSFLHSTLKVEDIVLTAHKNKVESLSLCDINNMFGTIEFYKLCVKYKIKPLIGMDVIVSEEDGNSYSFLLIAKNNNGYKTLTKLTSLVSRFDNKYGITYNTLINNLDDVLVIIPFNRSYIYSLYKLERNHDIDQVIERYKQHLNDMYIGINYDLTFKYDQLRDYFKQKNIKRVALPYINSQNITDQLTLKALKSIKEGRTLNEQEEIEYGYFDKVIDNDYFTYDEIHELNNVKDKCNVDLSSFTFNFVNYERISKLDSVEHLKDLCTRGLNKRLNTNKPPVEYLNRLSYEIEVIIKMGFQNYFLVVYDYVKFAKTSGMLVGPGRGSAAGSLVAYVLGITNVDPLKYGLMFERFLNIERISMPDIDIDFPDNRRQEVIDYIKNRYGIEHTAHVITFQTFGARQALRDVAKVFGLPLYQVDSLVKKLPHFDLFSTLNDFYHKYENVRTTIDNDPLYQKIFDVAKNIEGLPRQSSLHAAGIVVSDLELKETIPIYYVDEMTVATQYDMNYIEDVGLLKMDVLGLKNLTIINDCLKDIKEFHHIDININSIDMEDENVYKMIASGRTMGLFQIERSGMIKAIKTINPNCFEDIVAVIALYRPGPMQFIEDYALKKEGKMEITYIHPLLEPILKVTHGIIVYQEQIIQILTTMANFSLGKADIIRRAISKKDDQVISSMKNEFVKGSMQNNVNFKIASDVFNLIERFADYGFNRAHSVSYALICYQMAYLKYHYPSIFFANILNAFGGSASLGGVSKFMQYLNEAASIGINLLPPSINKSQISFYPSNEKQILYSLTNIKGIQLNFAKNIVSERLKREFDDIFDFVMRMYAYDINEKQLEALTNAGCFDEFHLNRASIRDNITSLLQYANMVNTKIDGQIIIDESLSSKPRLKFTSDNNLANLELEYDAIGLFLSGFPLQNDRKRLTKKRFIRICDINEESLRVFLVLYVQSKSIIKTKKGENMLTLKCYDETGFIEVTVFPSLFNEAQSIIKDNKYIKLDAKVNLKNETINLLATRIQAYVLGEE